MKYTPTPWAINHGPNPWDLLITPVHGHPVAIARMLDRHHLQAFANGQEILEANTRRIVACVNACAGIDNPTDLRQQRDDLLAALKNITLPFDDCIQWVKALADIREHCTEEDKARAIQCASLFARNLEHARAAISRAKA